MKFGITSLDYRRYPLETCFDIAHRYGFDGLEIFGSRLHLFPDDLTLAKATEILGYKRKYNIEVPMYTPNSINLPYCICSTIPQERKDGIIYYKKGVDVTAAIEAQRMLVVADHPGYFSDQSKNWEHLVESIVEICDYASHKGVEVTIEPLTPLESPVVTTAADCSRLIKQVNNDNLYAMMDIVPPLIVHEPFSRYFTVLGSRLDYIHICNTDGKTDAHLQLDNGILDLYDVMTVIKDHHFEGFITTELYSESAQDPELLAAHTSNILSEIRSKLEI